jgi:sugar lactone lactonase YvrE
MRRDIRGYSHIVTSREGLFVVTPTSYKRVMRGAYFGLTVKDGVVYCFQSCGPKRGGKNGRILRIPIESGRLGRVRVIATGLDDGCHQIDFVGDDLLIVDCYNGRILRMDPATGRYEAFHPLGELTRQVARDEYHMNSVSLSPDGTIWALLHNTNRKHSEVIVLDQQFAIVRRFTVDAACAHNIVFTNDELEYLIADSTGGKVLSAQRTVIDEGSMRFRGIALDHTTCAIGESLFSTRPFRRFVPGAIHFYDRATWTRQASLRLPAAPTDVRRIDGQDFSLSNYLASQITGAARVGGRPTAVADRREVAAVALGATRSA